MEAIVKINMFNFTQKVFITDFNSPTGFKAHDIVLTNLSDFLMSIEDLKSIHIFGEEKFLIQIINEIKEKEIAKYSANNIRFYINK